MTSAPAPASAPKSRRIAYLVSRYPALSHAFITREIAGLESSGVGVERFSARPADPAHLLSETDESEARKTFVLMSEPARHVAASLRLLARAPRTYARVLRTAVGGGSRGLRHRVTRLGYFSEAVVLAAELDRRDIGHLHVHFANNGAEIARLTALLRPMTWSVVLHSLAMHGRDHTPTADWPHRNAGSWGPLTEKLRSASIVFCISEDSRAHAQALLAPEDDVRFAIVRMGVDTSRFPAAGEQRRARSRSYASILFVGRLADEKDPLAVLRAVATLRRRGYDVRVTFAGDGPLRADLQAQVLGHGGQAWASVLGGVSQDQLPALYTDADVFCLPSRVEGVPAVLMEAMATELPVISTTRDGIPELVRDGVSGLLVDYDDPDALAAALGRLIDDPDLRAAMGRAGREHVSREFSTRHESDVLSGQLAPMLAGGSAAMPVSPAR